MTRRNSNGCGRGILFSERLDIPCTDVYPLAKGSSVPLAANIFLTFSAASRLSTDHRMKPPEQDLENRKPVWDVMQMIYMDTDVDLELPHMARICAASPYSIENLKDILFKEVFPLVARTFTILSLRMGRLSNRLAGPKNPEET